MEFKWLRSESERRARRERGDDITWKSVSLLWYVIRSVIKRVIRPVIRYVIEVIKSQVKSWYSIHHDTISSLHQLFPEEPISERIPVNTTLQQISYQDR